MMCCKQILKHFKQLVPSLPVCLLKTLTTTPPPYPPPSPFISVLPESIKQNARFLEKYHRGVWTKSLGKFNCCDQVDRSAVGCVVATTDRQPCFTGTCPGAAFLTCVFIRTLVLAQCLVLLFEALTPEQFKSVLIIISVKLLSGHWRQMYF